MSNPFINLRNTVDTDKSIGWYRDQVKALANISPSKLMTNKVDLVNRILPGNMYMFFYDAKHKDTLPYWDRFPLVIPFRSVVNGFYGINLHYLPYLLRFKVLGALHQYASDKEIKEDTRIKASWSIIETAARTPQIKHCVKHYLNNHVQSKFLQIKYPDWVVASQLPVERFVGSTKQKVWEEGSKK